MGETRFHAPSMPLAAIFSRHANARAWARDQLTMIWGQPVLISPEYEFRETNYYAASMGLDLIKQFLAFEPGWYDPAGLSDWKLTTNRLESDYQQIGNHPENRPLNIDPGYLTEAKLVLATTKDRDHRIYLRDGIYAEVTLHWHHGKWAAERWTYPDYQRPDYHLFFCDCRNRLRGSAG